jgi:hypothetical protein
VSRMCPNGWATKQSFRMSAGRVSGNGSQELHMHAIGQLDARYSAERAKLTYEAKYVSRATAP